ncbi:MAG: FAD-dependent oxidoreductase [Chloroflexota bacterium]
MKLVIDFTRHLDQVVEVNREEGWVRVQPGIVLDELNLHLRPYGLQFGPDPASSNRAAMGGIVSNNSTGAHSILYGMTADHVLAMDVILADGTKAHFGPLTATELVQRQRRAGLEGLFTNKRPFSRSVKAIKPLFAKARRAIGGVAAAITSTALFQKRA